MIRWLDYAYFSCTKLIIVVASLLFIIKLIIKSLKVISSEEECVDTLPEDVVFSTFDEYMDTQSSEEKMVKLDGLKIS